MGDGDKSSEEAWGMLEEIHDAVVGNYPEGMPRRVPEPGENAYSALKHIEEKAPVTSSDLEEHIGNGNTRVLSRLYDTGLVNRDKNPSGIYIYTGLTNWGEEILRNGETMEDQQTRLNDKGEETQTNPWDGVNGIGEYTYKFLVEVDESEGHPTTNDVADELGEGLNKVSPAATRLYEGGYVGRPAKQPYYYWLTEEGEKLLRELRRG